MPGAASTMSLMSFIWFIIPAPLAPVLSARSRQWSTGALAVLLSRTESRRQTGTRAAAGSRDAAGRGRQSHDPSAVSVCIDGLLVGYLPRDLASALRPGLLATQEREGKPIALEGVIVKGAMRGDGGSRLSVVLRYDPEDFGLSASPEVKHADSRPRTDPERNKHRSGIAWNKFAVRSILINPLYTGHQVWNKQRKDEVLIDVEDVALGHTTKLRWNQTDKWLWSEKIVHPPVIDRETFDQVQAIVAGRGP